MIMNNKYWRVVEPFKLVGENSIIWSKNQAQKVAVDISYYFLVLGVTLVGVYLFQLFQLFYLLPPEYPKELALKTGGLVLILGVLVRYFTSRIASVLLTFGSIYLLWKGILWMKYLVMFSGSLMTLSYAFSIFIILIQLFKKRTD